MDIELVEFTFDFKLKQILKSNLNPINYLDISNNIYYCNLFYYFEYLFEFHEICILRRKIILNTYHKSYNIIYLNDLFSPLYDRHSYYKFIHCAKKFNKIKNVIYNNLNIYNSMLTYILKNLY